MTLAFARVLRCVVAMETLSRTTSTKTFGGVLLLIERDSELVEVMKKLGINIVEGLEWGLLRAFITHVEAMQGVMRENEWIKRERESERETPARVARLRCCCSWKEKMKGDILSEGAQMKGVSGDWASFISKTVLTNPSLNTHFLWQFLNRPRTFFVIYNITTAWHSKMIFGNRLRRCIIKN